MKPSFVLQTENLHLDDGGMIPAQVCCTPGESLRICPGKRGGADCELAPNVHIALARADTHVHFRESTLPGRDEFEADPYKKADMDYEELCSAIRDANRAYDVRRGSLAALKGGVWLVGAMGNTPWAPIGIERWKRMAQLYQEQALIYTHVWPRMEPGVPPVEGQEEKDFGSTFGGSGISQQERRSMYLERRGGMVSYHNDRPRNHETLEVFKERVKPPDYLLHPLYFDGDTVLEAQSETLALAREAKLNRLLTRHIPTGPALDQILQARKDDGLELPAEVGLDYLYFNRDMLATTSTRDINYRRPALPAQNDQASLIELTRDAARSRDALAFIGSDHAPHALKAKAFRKGGLPGSPGTRVLEHSHQIHMHLLHECGYSHADIDWLTAIVPARYIAKYRQFPFPVGAMQDGAMANLVVFDPDMPYRVNEESLRLQLQDDEYHSAYRDEDLRGSVLFTVVNGVVFDVRDDIRPVNASFASAGEHFLME